MPWSYRTVRDGGSFGAEATFQENGVTRQFKSASGFKTEGEARQWVYEQQAKNVEAAEPEQGGG